MTLCGRNFITLALAIFLLLPAPAFAIAFPLTPSDVDSAIAVGQSRNYAQLMMSPEWRIRCSFVIVDGRQENCRRSRSAADVVIETPFYGVAVSAATHRGRYEDMSGARQDAQTLNRAGVLSFSCVVQSRILYANREPVFIIRQNGQIVRAAGVSIDNDPTVSDVDAYFMSAIDGTFKLSSFDASQPFEFILAAIDNYGASELHWLIDPAKVR